VAKNECRHLNFACEVAVNRLEDSGRFHADVRICCEECGLPFQFDGLPVGLDFGKPTVSFDGREARMPISPHEPVFPFVERG
jgi:hypothetical protein